VLALVFQYRVMIAMLDGIALAILNLPDPL